MRKTIRIQKKKEKKKQAVSLLITFENKNQLQDDKAFNNSFFGR